MQAAASGGPTRSLDVIAPVALRYLSEVRLFAPGAERPVEVEVAALRDRSTGTLELKAPTGWKITPASQPFNLGSAGESVKLAFNVIAPSEPGTAAIAAVAHLGDATWNSGRIVIKHPHIPVQLLQPSARLKAVSLDLAKKGRRVGYIPGAGDHVAEALEEMGYEVTQLAGADLTPEKLKDLDCVVIGVRAYNVRDDLAAKNGCSLRLCRGRGNGRRPVQPAERAQNDSARAIRTTPGGTPASPTRAHRLSSSRPTTPC